MRIHFGAGAKILGTSLVALSLFAAGYVAGQNKFGQPKSVLHVVELQWRPGVPDMQKQAAIDGIKDMAAKMPGVKSSSADPSRGKTASPWCSPGVFPCAIFLTPPIPLST